MIKREALSAIPEKLEGEFMSIPTEQKIIDGDGHVVEDIATIWKYMPEQYVGRSFSDARSKSPFPPIDHMHTANRHFTPRGAFANVGREGWELFLDRCRHRHDGALHQRRTGVRQNRQP